ncbi:capsular polysaccharide biosynthesis protein CapF [Pseudomonas argentinensis]|uniref:UDP-2-acetamido-2,6-beta-L-arabino-hexul-4-ose reductase n=1 Tax=Phytopseudomonas argentinensis TaxID=289370 RepID=A0A1I3L0E6_9GAMM|nr:capsular polysaccharide biosynthesis protein CapF [Pseudomonas argentinensis]KAB0550288.1 capsular polysaccharide biosynthesis protein CapF [Pseudomonas argentinensis]SFI78222.1 UDP-2-acetamido-2,6-beta-L-arabino-hexul-4-ose reductase [Pseudomonas argentinensis]
MKVLITGANGFVGKNLIVHLNERQDVEILTFGRSDELKVLGERVAQADFIFHLAGVNRPQDPAEFGQGNTELTVELCKAIETSARQIPVVYTSSSQATLDNPYGASKRGAEEALQRLAQQHGSPVHVLRLPNVFGKWARPNYNSAVATFCHNIARDLPIQINDPAAVITLVYIDDVIAHFLALMAGEEARADVQPQYRVSVGEIADRLRSFKESRNTLVTDRVGGGFVRALYSTYLSYLPPEHFTYKVPKYGDPRGVFVEMLKTPDCGQFSFFTAHPGITRGGHYHHTKTEKFLVIKGRARFGFRHMTTGEFHEVVTEGDSPQIVETVPGWTHDITNIGDDEMIVMLWANEIFDRAHPDTYACQVKP